MGVEIERKFLLANQDWRRAVERSEDMDQGYLGGERASLRVRIVGASAFLNIKSKQGGARRLEFEYPLPLEDARQLLEQLALPGRIEKRRHHVRYQGHHWEIDEFLGENAGLVVAEIELSAEDETFARPPWLGREVTDDLRYYNAALAQHPYCRWGGGHDKEN